jgi:hypothetical protein
MHVDKEGEYKNKRIEVKVDADNDKRVNDILEGGYRRGIKYRSVILHQFRGRVISDAYYLDKQSLKALNDSGANELFKDDIN